MLNVVISLILLFSLSISKGITDHLKTPPGFEVSIYASNLGKARFMAFNGGGVMFISSTRIGKIYALRDYDNDGQTDENIIFAEGMDSPHGITFFNNFLYVAEEGRILRFRCNDGDLSLNSTPEVIVSNLPTEGGGHYTRTIVFGPDSMMYVSVGSSCNLCLEEDNRRAAVVRYTPDGKRESVIAKGLRNSVGIVFNPETGELWGTDNGRDWLGDELPLEEINIIREGNHYGWPYMFGGNIPDPKFGDLAPNDALFTPPAFELPAHWAPLGLRFCSGTKFPEEYQSNLFVANHGSWNSSVKVGYNVVRIKFINGKPVGMEDFLTGFLTKREKVLGRPVDIIFDSKGIMYVSDDYAGNVYRIEWLGD